MRRPGVALPNVLMLSLLTMTFLVVAVQFVQGSANQGRKDRWRNQTYNVALAGINQAASWFQKQSSEPTSFDPRALSAAEPDEDQETEASAQQLGLIREFEVDPSNGVWGRYEVGRSNNAPARDSLATGAAEPTLYPGGVTWTVEDVSKQRGFADPGTVWRVRSRGYLFSRQVGATTPSFNPTASPGPQGVLTLEGDVRRLKLNPYAAALYVYRNNSAAGWPHISIDANNNWKTTILGGGGAMIWSNTGKVAYQRDSWVTNDGALVLNGQTNPTSNTYVDPSTSAQLRHVFGTSSLAALKTMADRYPRTPAEIPQPMAPMEFVYIRPISGLMTFGGSGNPNLSGGGILFVEGNLSIESSSVEQKWNGLIFVTGNYRQVRKSTVTGSVIAGGNVRLYGYNNQEAKLVYSGAEISRIQTQLGKYQLQRSTLRVVD